MENRIYVNVNTSRFVVDDDDRVFRVAYGEEREIKAGKTVDEARRLAKNLRAIRASAAAREGRGSR